MYIELRMHNFFIAEQWRGDLKQKPMWYLYNLHAVSQCLNRECNGHYTRINAELRASVSISAS